MAKRTNIRSEADETAVKSARQKEERGRSRTAAPQQPDNPDPMGDVDEPVAPIREPNDAEEPSEKEIRVRAYHRYLERGGSHGAHFDDWLEAERELKNTKVKGSKSEP